MRISITHGLNRGLWWRRYVIFQWIYPFVFKYTMKQMTFHGFRHKFGVLPKPTVETVGFAELSIILLTFAILKKITYKMHVTSEEKKKIFKQYGKSEKNTGSSESQIALFTQRISYLTDHLNGQKKDYSTQQALIKLVGKRRSLLDYLQKTDIERYRKILADLNIRK